VPHVPDELSGDREVIAALHLLPVAARVGDDAVRLELKREDVREPGAEPVHRPLRADRVGEGNREEVTRTLVVRAGAEEVADAAG
jgi:hypothetical protein